MDRTRISRSRKKCDTWKRSHWKLGCGIGGYDSLHAYLQTDRVLFVQKLNVW